MHHFFVDPSCIRENEIWITGPDVKHMKQVLRMRAGEEFLISDGLGGDYQCCLTLIDHSSARARILTRLQEEKELPSELWLFQGLPKSDKMEFIIQKAVELGAFSIVPVITKNVVVKLDEKKAGTKQARWQAIAKSAAEQSKRSRIPQIGDVINLEEALLYIQENDFAVRLIPYENAEGMEGMKKALASVKPGQKIAVLIGPEGGFEKAEIALALENGIHPVSLGRRILRTETAGLAMLSLLMMKIEGAF